MSTWMLEYDGELSLRMPQQEAESLSASSFYKLSLRRYMAGYQGGVFQGKASLTYLDFKRILSLCCRECEKCGIDLHISDALQQYIHSRENYLEQRSRLGIEIKNRDPKFTDRFEKYRDVVNRAMSRPLRERQMWDSFFMCSMRRSANFYDTGNANLILINYAAVNGVLKELLPLIKDDTLLVFDEVHNVKRIGGEYAGAALLLA